MKVRVNRAGVIFIGITIFLGVAAVNTANNLLYLVVSYMLSFMLLSGMLSLYNLKGLEVLLLPPEEVYASTEAPFRVIVKNTKKLPSFLIEVKKGGSYCLFPFIKEVGEGVMHIHFEGRGLYKSIEVEISSSFPVGLFERFYSLKVPLSLVVFPKPLATNEKSLHSLGKEKNTLSQHSKVRGCEELEDIRKYTNEPIKLIHWKLSAKTGELYVKGMVEEASPPIMLSLNSVDGSLEERISKLTYLIVKFISQGRAVGLELPHTTIEASTGIAHKRRLLTELALL
ncbi:MAG: DUF58 domain-containing protein [Aquificaceae bacterium]